MKLKETQIEELYKFTRQHFVEYYDVQSELVDHLANDIEDIWEEKPQISFEKARDISFQKFGVFGFMNVIESRQKALSKRYMKILWRFVKEWFTFPKILVTTSIFLLSYATFQLKHGYAIFLTLLLIFGIIDLVLATKLKKKSKLRFKNKNKKWMLEEMIFNTGAFSGILILSNIFQIATLADDITSTWGQMLFSIFITLAIIHSYISLIIIPQKADELLENQYPEYKLSQNM
ncbi:MAG: hypothetical protein JKY02_10385 [Flavobacteriaceae bacterium]|nr:hypothetical protein [Flavobacteriaceae bacterium]